MRVMHHGNTIIAVHLLSAWARGYQEKVGEDGDTMEEGNHLSPKPRTLR